MADTSTAAGAIAAGGAVAGDEQPSLPSHMQGGVHFAAGSGIARARRGGLGADANFDGRVLRRGVARRTVDYAAPTILMLETEPYVSSPKELPHVQPDTLGARAILPPEAWQDNPATSVCTKFVHTSINKVRCPINTVKWTPDSRRLITGCSTGEITLWNGLTYNFETILQAHDTAVRSMAWSHDGDFMITGDEGGIIKYWQANMNNVKAFTAHTEAVRGVSFAPTSRKFASCSNDGSVGIWDFATVRKERDLTGHGWDVRCVEWHPSKGVVASGSKDNQIKLWDAKTGTNIASFHKHKNTVQAVQWNRNGNWLVSASRDQLLKMFDVRMMREVIEYKGHKREVWSVAWHPVHEDLFVSGGYDGSMLYWRAGQAEPIAEVFSAHDNSIWSMAWHPLGHVLATGSNDQTTKFWTRNRPGDEMADKYNDENWVRAPRLPRDQYLALMAERRANMPAHRPGPSSASVPGYQARHGHHHHQQRGYHHHQQQDSQVISAAAGHAHALTHKHAAAARAAAGPGAGFAAAPPAVSGKRRGSDATQLGASGANLTPLGPPVYGQKRMRDE